MLVIEHNLDVIKTADWVIDLGPDGGERGGAIVAEGTPEDVAREPASYTGQYLRPLLPRAAVSNGGKDISCSHLPGDGEMPSRRVVEASGGIGTVSDATGNGAEKSARTRKSTAKAKEERVATTAATKSGASKSAAKKTGVPKTGATKTGATKTGATKTGVTKAGTTKATKSGRTTAAKKAPVEPSTPKPKPRKSAASDPPAKPAVSKQSARGRPVPRRKGDR